MTLPKNQRAITNGAGAASILAAGIGCFTVGLFTLAGDVVPTIARFFTFYKPSGPLSGVTTGAIIVWLATWYTLSRAWSDRDVAIGKVCGSAYLLLVLSLFLTFPPFINLLQGK